MNTAFMLRLDISVLQRFMYQSMSDREPTRWQHNRIYPHPISPCLYTYDSRLYCCEIVDAHCSNIIKL